MNLICLITIYVVGVSARQILNVDHIVRRNAGQLPSYPSPSAPAESSVDLHNKEFCVDVSTYQPVVWVERDGEECKTDFVKQCEDKSENVCAEVTETFCEVLL